VTCLHIIGGRDLESIARLFIAPLCLAGYPRLSQLHFGFFLPVEDLLDQHNHLGHLRHP
jgi:hypothetical protein